jgi:hypothetical protein
VIDTVVKIVVGAATGVVVAVNDHVVRVVGAVSEAAVLVAVAKDVVTVVADAADRMFVEIARHRRRVMVKASVRLTASAPIRGNVLTRASVLAGVAQTRARMVLVAMLRATVARATGMTPGTVRVKGMVRVTAVVPAKVRVSVRASIPDAVALPPSAVATPVLTAATRRDHAAPARIKSLFTHRV